VVVDFVFSEVWLEVVRGIEGILEDNNRLAPGLEVRTWGQSVVVFEGLLV